MEASINPDLAGLAEEDTKQAVGVRPEARAFAVMQVHASHVHELAPPGRASLLQRSALAAEFLEARGDG